MNDYINYYDLLGVSKTATVDEIKKAYREQAKKWHPDLNKDPKAPEMAKKINDAKDILLDETKRKDYDIYLENYKNGMYDNLNKNTYNPNNNYTEKTYTKWEYFSLYLKYYKVSTFRKVIATIFVLLESFICGLLEIINYAFAFLVAYFSYYLSAGFLIIGIGIAILLFSKSVFSLSLPEFFNNELLTTFIIFISLFLSVFIQVLPTLLINTIPRLLSKLNLALFKLSIGYK